MQTQQSLTFQEALSSFSLQPIEDVLEINEREGDCSPVSWALNILSDAHKNYISPNPVLKDIREEMARRLYKRISPLLLNLDIDILNALSAERYESAEGKGLALSFIPFSLGDQHAAMFDGKATFFFDQDRMPLSLGNVHGIRKQLNMTKDMRLAICPSNHGHHSFCTAGILPPQADTLFPKIVMTGHMEWMLYMPGQEHCLVCYRQGRLLLPPLDITKLQAERISKKFNIGAQHVSKLLQQLRSHRHGALVIFGPSRVIKSEAFRLCETNHRGIMLRPHLLAPEEIDRLCSIDGALLIDFNGNCYACGAILDGKACTKGDMSRGSRYNSSQNYVASIREASECRYWQQLKSRQPAPLDGSLSCDKTNCRKRNCVSALVFSEDGMVDVLLP